MWTSSLECSNNKSSGVVVALARPTVTGKTNNLLLFSKMLWACVICTTRNGPRHQNREQPKNSPWSYSYNNTLLHVA